MESASIYILIIVYVIAFLVAAFVLKKHQRAILWTGALILFFGTMLLLGLGLYVPKGFAGVLHPCLALVVSGLIILVAEKQNCIKVIYNILSIDWLNQYYKEIDVDKTVSILKTIHLGHEKQLEDLRIQLLTSNFMKKVPKTISLIGRSCGCGSLAKAFAEAIGIKYVEIDLSGRKSKENDALAGTSRIYENGRCGYIFEQIMQVGRGDAQMLQSVRTMIATGRLCGFLRLLRWLIWYSCRYADGCVACDCHV